jgi:hypothetical protein
MPNPPRDSLRQTLARDFPEECLDLPISGGWGGTQADAIVFVRDRFPPHRNFVRLEYFIAQKVLWQELIPLRLSKKHFLSVSMKCNRQDLITDGGRRYDRLTFEVAYDSDRGIRLFGLPVGRSKRVSFEKILWFDITNVFER